MICSGRNIIFLCLQIFGPEPSSWWFSVPSCWMNEWTRLCLSCDDFYFIKPYVLNKTFSLTPSSQQQRRKENEVFSQCVSSGLSRGRWQNWIDHERDWLWKSPSREKGQWRMGEPSDHVASLTTTEKETKDWVVEIFNGRAVKRSFRQAGRESLGLSHGSVESYISQ